MNYPKTVSLQELERLANESAGGRKHIFLWLVDVGLVPPNYVATRKSVVRLGGDSGAISTEYLASTAREWDDWGTTTPAEFVTALKAEYDEHYANVSEILSDLGRE